MNPQDRIDLDHLRDRVDIATEVLETAEASLYVVGRCGHDKAERLRDAVAMAKHRLREAKEDLMEFEVMIGLRPLSEMPEINTVTAEVKEVVA